MAHTIELDGQTRTLCFDLGAWEAIETQGTTLDAVLEEFGTGKTLSFKAVRILVWAMLQGEGVTVEQVRHGVTGQNFTQVLTAVGEVLRETFPKEAAPANPPPAGRSTTASSGTGSMGSASRPGKVAAGV